MSSDRSNPSPLPPAVAPDHRRATLSLSMGANKHMSAITNTNHFATQRQFHNPTQKVPTMGTHMGSMPYIPGNMHHTNTPIIAQEQNHTLAHFATSGRPRGSLPGFNMPPNMVSLHIYYKFLILNVHCVLIFNKSIHLHLDPNSPNDLLGTSRKYD